VDLRSHTLSSGPISPKTPRNAVPDRYWEEKWRVLHKAEKINESNSSNDNRTSKKSWTEKVHFTLARTESDPSPAKPRRSVKQSKPSVRRNLLQDLSRHLGLEEDVDNISSHESSATDVGVEGESGVSANKDLICTSEDRCFNANATSEENSSIFSDPPSPESGANDHENSSDKSSVASNLFVDESDDRCKTVLVESHLPISTHLDSVSEISDSDSRNAQCNDDSAGESGMGAKERKVLLGKFHWLWKFGLNSPGQETSQRGGNTIENESSRCSSSGSSIIDVSGEGSNGVDQNMMGSFKNLGQSMLEHIQVIESVFQQDRGQMGSLDLVGKGQVTAMTALSELRKISNLLSEM
jgi:TBC1 domain family protein 5